MSLQESIANIKGVGKQKTALLKRINIESLEDAITYYPRDYETNTSICSISDIVLDQVNIIEGSICNTTRSFFKKGLTITQTRIEDTTGKLYVVWYRQPYLDKKLKVGQSFILKGKVTKKYNRIQMVSPQIFNPEQYDKTYEGFIPIYALTKEIKQIQLKNVIKSALNMTHNQLKEFLPKNIRKKYQLAEYNFAIQQIHYPNNIEALDWAKKRLVFDEFLLYGLGLQWIKKQRVIVENSYTVKCDTSINPLIEQLPFTLTKAQQKVWKEIKQDLVSHKTMHRLVQGDVGSGKTIIAAMAIYYVIKNRYQAAMMAPTEVLAKQHYQSLKAYLEPLDSRIVLLVGSLTQKEKKAVYEKINQHEVDVVIGTHALIQEKVHFKKLALVITDEQHRFGVNQREKLTGKGVYPHVLVMSATPIPRTLALIVYGDMDVSIIDKRPPGRQEIKTYAVNTSYRSRIYQFLEKEIDNGRQAYIICPMVDESEKLELESVIDYTEKLKNALNPDRSIQYLHGKMATKEKTAIMENFKDGEIEILVSTTVIEVGIDVPNATVIMIENADRFGLAQLHQLRGRVGRGAYQSYCILISDSKSELTKKRMEVMVRSTDGFVISEYDLKLRGPGDFFGMKQHGLPEFKLANIFEDIAMLKETHLLAKSILKEDPSLSSEKYKYLNQKLQDFFKKNIESLAL